jgi:hypothetical protein
VHHDLVQFSVFGWNRTNRRIPSDNAAASTATSIPVGSAVLLVAPTANAVPLSNGLDIECFLDNTTNHVKCVTMRGCPRVHGDYVVDALHVMINGHQDE